LSKAAKDSYQQSWQGRERAQKYEQRADLVLPKRQEMLSLIAQLIPFRQRSLDEAAGVKSATLEDILAWLKQAGFAQVECYWKHFQWAVFGASKGDGGTNER
jgi:hypothetical protein